jgi:DNA-binding transcriptional regulator YiaG
MPNLASTLKHEITRLARKEARGLTKSLRKFNAQYRRDIAELKRVTGGLTKRVAFLEAQERKRAQDAPRRVDTEGRRFSARGLKTHRDKLSLSASDYGRLVGVTGQTIYNWEQGKARPREEQLASLVAVRGFGKREAWRRLDLLTG